MSTLSTIYDDGHEYDLLSPVKAGPEETAFYERYGHSVAGPTLELACGTGRLTIALSQSGIDIVGIDIARSMLSVAREKAKHAGASARFVEADMRQFSVDERFGLIFIPNNSIAHPYTLDDFRSCLACERRQLNLGGLFIIAFFNPALNFLSRDPSVRHPVKEYEGSNGERVVVTENNRYDSATQINHVTWFLTRQGSEQVRTLDLRIYYPQELDALVSSSGFKILDKFGDFMGAPFTSASKQQVLVCHASEGADAV